MTTPRVIGVDLGGTKILAGLVERDGTVVRHREHPTPVESQEALLAGLHGVIEELLDDSVAAIGLGIPATIDQPAGRAVFAPNIPLQELALRELVRERFGVPVGLDNDANVAAIAEWQAGAARGSRHVVMLTLGTGVGGGLVLDGKPYRGSMGAGAELGHMVIEHDGPPCVGRCTGRGHLEALCSGTAAGAAARAAFGPAVDSHRLVRLANEGDGRALAILDDIGRKLGSAIGTIVNVFNPEVVVVGGGFGAAAGDHLLVPARELLRREALPPGRDLVRVERAKLASVAGMVGAAFVGYEALERE